MELDLKKDARRRKNAEKENLRQAQNATRIARQEQGLVSVYEELGEQMDPTEFDLRRRNAAQAHQNAMQAWYYVMNMYEEGSTDYAVAEALHDFHETHYEGWRDYE